MARLAGVYCSGLLAAVAVAAVAAAAAAAATGGESEAEEAVSSYIVHVAHAHAPRSSRTHLQLGRAYHSFLRDNLPESVAHPEPRVFYSYQHAATGFAARLTARQAAHLESLDSVVLAVMPDREVQAHTTLTPKFLELSESVGLLEKSKGATDVVIGVIDSGVYPIGRASFAADPSLPPPPDTFSGGCVSTPSFDASAYCNNKLVGAKFFVDGYELQFGKIDETVESRSPLDTNGHGTHTASTAAGSHVENASFYRYAKGKDKGKAVGMAPGARIAVYKALWNNGRGSAIDLLAAFEHAIADGVDVISYSIGFGSQWAPPLYLDPSAVAGFRAVRKGIVVSVSAGNDGPAESTVVNPAPWILTVGASTINRWFPATVVLGNGQAIIGASLYAGKPLGAAKIPLVYGGDVGSPTCEAGRLNTRKVAGKIVLCTNDDDTKITRSGAAKGEAVKLAGGAGAIVVSPKNHGKQLFAEAHVLPAAGVAYADALKIYYYIKAHAYPVATIKFIGTVVGPVPSSPRVASFSSRGPNREVPQILKPDVIAPGVEILAAWTGAKSPSQLPSDGRRVQYNIMSGTSMACPHVSGVAALLRQAHPDWSPAAIKSALMTTASVTESNGRHEIKDMVTGETANPFAYGAGHVSPNEALDPGLVYDSDANDNIDFLCSIGYSAQQIAIFTGNGLQTNCSKRSSNVGNHNYPSFSAVFRSDADVVTQRRVLTNVGRDAGVTYRAYVTTPPGVHVTVKPSQLHFSATRPAQEYTVTFTSRRNTGSVNKNQAFGSIVWTDSWHRVTSPIAVTWMNNNAVAEM